MTYLEGNSAIAVTFFALAFSREVLHHHWSEWSWRLLLHTLKGGWAEAIYAFAVHIFVYSGLFLPNH